MVPGKQLICRCAPPDCLRRQQLDFPARSLSLDSTWSGVLYELHLQLMWRAVDSWFPRYTRRRRWYVLDVVWQRSSSAHTRRPSTPTECRHVSAYFWMVHGYKTFTGLRVQAPLSMMR